MSDKTVTMKFEGLDDIHGHFDGLSPMLSRNHYKQESAFTMKSD